MASGLPLTDILVKLQDLKFVFVLLLFSKVYHKIIIFASFRREDIWDAGQSMFGLLKGQLLQDKLQRLVNYSRR